MQNHSCPGATLAFSLQGENYVNKARGELISVKEWVICLSKLLCDSKSMPTETVVKTYTEAKFTLGSLICPRLSSDPGFM